MTPSHCHTSQSFPDVLEGPLSNLDLRKRFFRRHRSLGGGTRKAWREMAGTLLQPMPGIDALRNIPEKFRHEPPEHLLLHHVRDQNPGGLRIVPDEDLEASDFHRKHQVWPDTPFAT